MPMMNEFQTTQDMVAALYTVVVDALNQAIAARGRASLAVSGGSTPKPLFQALSNADLPWEQVSVALVDERWVEPGDPGSNERFAKDNLLQNRAAAARFIGMKTAHADPGAAVETVEAAYQAIDLPFDVVILGLGPDGHTASWFPHAQGLPEAIDPQTSALVGAVRAHPSKVTGAFLDRMTLTLPPIAGARHTVLMIAGQEKRDALNTAMGAGETAEMPMRALLRHDTASLAVYCSAK